MMSTQYNYAGIDIAKRNFVIGITSLQRTKTETNNPKGIAHTIEYLKKHKVALVVMESTGGLEIPTAKAIHRAGIAVIIAKPNIPLLFVGLRLRLTQPLYLLNWLIFMFISKIASGEIQHLFVAVFFCYGLYPFGLLGKTGDFEFVSGFN